MCFPPRLEYSFLKAHSCFHNTSPIDQKTTKDRRTNYMEYRGFEPYFQRREQKSSNTFEVMKLLPSSLVPGKCVHPILEVSYSILEKITWAIDQTPSLLPPKRPRLLKPSDRGYDSQNHCLTPLDPFPTSPRVPDPLWRACIAPGEKKKHQVIISLKMGQARLCTPTVPRKGTVPVTRI